jgi:hypothetical protein
VGAVHSFAARTTLVDSSVLVAELDVGEMGQAVGDEVVAEGFGLVQRIEVYRAQSRASRYLARERAPTARLGRV